MANSKGIWIDQHKKTVAQFEDYMAEHDCGVKAATKALKTYPSKYYYAKNQITAASNTPGEIVIKQKKSTEPVIIHPVASSQLCIIMGSAAEIKEIFQQMGRMS